MRFLVDVNLSPRLAALLQQAEHDAVHAADLEFLTATDERVLEVARDPRRVVVFADSDFATILARTHALSPSVIFVRRTAGRRVVALSKLVLANFPRLKQN